MDQVFRHLLAMCLVVLHFGLVCSAHTALSPSPHNSPAPAPRRLHSPKSAQAQAPTPAPASGSMGVPSPGNNGPAPSSQAVEGPVSPPAPASIPTEGPGESPFIASVPAPAPAAAAAAAADDSASQEKDGTDANNIKSSSGLSGGQKAGIAVGVLFGVAAVGTGGIIYKKRQENIRRAQYGFAARREQL